MNRFLLALAVLVLAYNPAQAEFKGTLQRDQAWFVEIASSSTGDTAVTVYYLDRRFNVIETVLVPSAATVGRTFSIERGVTRIIVEVDPILDGQVTVRVVQGAEQFNSIVASSRGGDSFRLVFDVP
jgi:hypothetical protein